MRLIDTPTSRRRFIEWFAKGYFGVKLLGASPLLGSVARPRQKAKNVIYIFLRGGLSHIDTFDPKPGRAEMAGVKAINTSADGVQISEWFPRMSRQMHEVALVRSVTSTQGVHERGNYLARTSQLQTPTITHPALGAWVFKHLGSENPLLPGNVLINGSPQHPGSGYFEPHLAPLPIIDPPAGLQNSALMEHVTATDFARRTELARTLGSGFLERTPHRTATGYRHIQDKAVELMKSEDLKAFDIAKEDAAVREAYGTHTFGQGCLLARRLVEHGVRFVEVEDNQNWDTHNDHVVSMQRMTPSLDHTLAALLADLRQRGLLSSTLVVVATEFGRSPKMSEVTAGRGHHPAAFTWWLAGGGVKGGYVYGATDEAGERVADKPVTMPDLNATIAEALGIDRQKVEYSSSGRPFSIANDGKPVMDLFV